MLIAVEGQLQVHEVHEVASGSGRKRTLWVLASGSPVGATGLVSRWVRDLPIRALVPSVVSRVERQDLEDLKDLEGLVRRNPEIGLSLARVLAEQLMLMEADADGG
jgi:CRP-like cAMP-binding protein